MMFIISPKYWAQIITYLKSCILDKQTNKEKKTTNSTKMCSRLLIYTVCFILFFTYLLGSLP